ncbi:MAG: hypothetical protein K2H37_00450 [Lachnospiraceae bacterium]|nr:hypothetical protein [Lachnospiraceae bacterium]
MKWFSRKSNLDEMQELKLLKIESRGFWIGFFALFLAIMAQIFLFGQEFADHALGELIALLCMALYLIGGCLRNGIWDRHLQATPAVNIGLSLLAAAVTGLFNALISYRNYQSAAGAITVFVVFFLLVGVVLSVVLCFCSALYHRRRRQLEEEENGNETD